MTLTLKTSPQVRNVTVDRFKVGRDLEINIEVRPRTHSGVLVAVHGRMDFLVLQIVEGQVGCMFCVGVMWRDRWAVCFVLG